MIRNTSRAAFRAFDPTTVDGKIIAYIEANNGATVAEIEDNLALPHQTASAQVTHLRERGVLEDSHEKRPTPRGRAAIVWRLVQTGAQVTIDKPKTDVLPGQMTLLDVPQKRSEGSAWHL